jgi:tetratricopeptide (TPR) repeat protein
MLQHSTSVERLLAGTAAALTLAAAPAQAQEHDHTHTGAPPERLGRVEFPVSCNAEAQQRFERAMALLHSFWWSEADRAFDNVLEADPGCAMAYWGKALAARENPFGPIPRAGLERGLAAVARAEALDPPTPRERDYVAAAAVIYRDHERLDHRTRMLAFEEAMQRVHERYPEDPEAAIFYARSLVPNAPFTDRSFERQKRAAELLEPLFLQRPDHPGLAHYLIHAYDVPALAERGTRAAHLYHEIAPSVPHALHMPSHIFTRLGMWKESIEANARSAEAARQYEEENQATLASMDRVHAWDYLVYAYLQLGQDAAAHRLVEEAIGTRGVTNFAVEYGLAAIPARYALERGRWAEAARLPRFEAATLPEAAAVRHFARGIGAGRSGDAAGAGREAAALATIAETLRPRDAYWAQVVEAQRLAVAAWAARAVGDNEEALRLARQAVDLEEQQEKHPVTPGPLLPARELLGDLLLALGRTVEARQAYEQTLEDEPNRARTLHGAARAAELAGDHEAARRHYAQYVQLMAQASDERPELAAARRFLGGR